MARGSFGSEGEVKAGRPDLEEVEIRDDERVAGPPEEDGDEGDEQAEAAEQREQDDGGLAVARANSEHVAAVDVRDEGGADEHEGRHEDARDGGVEVREQLLEAEEVPRRLRDRRRDIAV